MKIGTSQKQTVWWLGAKSGSRKRLYIPHKDFAFFTIHLLSCTLTPSQVFRTMGRMKPISRICVTPRWYNVVKRVEEQVKFLLEWIVGGLSFSNNFLFLIQKNFFRNSNSSTISRFVKVESQHRHHFMTLSYTRIQILAKSFKQKIVYHFSLSMLSSHN